jgi:hypothetical protein
VEDIEGVLSSRESSSTLGGSIAGASLVMSPGIGPPNITSPPWSHSSAQSADTVTSAVMKGLRRALYMIGAVMVSREGGFLHKSVFGAAAMVKEPIQFGTASSPIFTGVNEELAGGMASVGSATAGAKMLGWRQRSAAC